jgi:NADH-quinone oxidoreductase subunit J
MTSLQLVFLLIAAGTVFAALMVVLSKHLVHAALWLILVLAGIAVLFVLLNAGFLAVVQVAVYIDAIAILIIIVVMLTQRAMGPTKMHVNRNWGVALLTAIVLFAGLLALFNQMPALQSQAPPFALDAEILLDDLGLSLVDTDRYIIPFEVASVLLLAALIGSIMIAWPRGSASEEERET